MALGLWIMRECERERCNEKQEEDAENTRNIAAAAM